MIKNQLRELKFQTESELRKSIIADLLSQGDSEDIEFYIKDVLTHAESKGIVSMLMYYNDVDKFFKRHYQEILSLLEEERTQNKQIPTALNSEDMALWTYRKVVQGIANQLKIEY